MTYSASPESRRFRLSTPECARGGGESGYSQSVSGRSVRSILGFFPVFAILCLPFLPVSAQEPETFMLSGSADFGAALTLYDTGHRFHSDPPGDHDWDVFARFEPAVRIMPGESLSIFIRGELETVNSSWTDVRAFLYEVSCSTDPADFLHLDLGKKRLEWGRAQFFNPVDFFQLPKNPRNPRSGKEAVPLFHAALLFPYLTLDALAVFGDRLEDTGAGGRLSLSGLVPGTDVSVLGHYSEPKKWCAGAVVETTPLSETGFLSDLTLYAEAGWTRLPDDPACDVSAGLRFSLPALDTMILAEYLFRSEGLGKDELEALVASGPSMPAGMDLSTVSRHNLYVTLMQPAFTTDSSRFTDTLSASFSVITSLVDMSCMLRLRFESSAIENLAIWIEGTALYGDENDVWRAFPVRNTAGAGFRAAF